MFAIRPRHPIALVALGLAATFGLGACSSGQEPIKPGSAVASVDGKIAITYLQKQGDQEYFVGEAEGAKAKTSELGIDLKVVNLGNDANKTISETQSAIAQKAHGLIVVVPDPAVGPQLVKTAQDANVALLTSDDQICTTGPDPATCGADALVPRVGFSGSQMGGEVGKRAGEEFKKAGWKAEDTRTISAWKQDVTVCTDRVKASAEAFTTASGATVGYEGESGSHMSVGLRATC
ncbi:substrate-binding domain-containing protein [Streptosporangium sp. CA-135522]|uniref:substrate-binding domain-containing protein n=1 Tax=Streptosporangium sp. CA-135522 TaxID=3240072 RepID=UPI003D91C797